MVKNKLELKFKMTEAESVCYSFYEDDRGKPEFIVVSEAEITGAISILEERGFVCERYGNRTASYLFEELPVRTQLAEYADGGKANSNHSNGFKVGYCIRVFAVPTNGLGLEKIARAAKELKLPYKKA
jgi:hypothetical protein